MSKVLIMPSNTKQFNLPCDGILIGIKNLSVGVLEVDINDIKNIKDKEIFVFLNKNIHNDEIPYLKDILIKLNDLNVKVIFYDYSIVNLKKKLNLKYDLIWAQEHHSTNYLTGNFWSNYSVDGMWISNDITLEETKKIIDNVKLYTMVTLFGYLPIFVSRRTLITNYLKTFKLKEKKDYLIHKENKFYPILENNDTQVFSSFILNGLKESLEINPNYIILNSFKIDNFEKVLDIFNKVNKINEDKLDKELNELIPNLGKGFLFEETIYKVKKWWNYLLQLAI